MLGRAIVYFDAQAQANVVYLKMSAHNVPQKQLDIIMHLQRSDVSKSIRYV